MNLASFRRPWIRVVVVLAAAAGAAALLVFRGPSWSAVADAFTAVRWQWVIAAIGLNLLSVVVRAMAWQTVIRAATPPPRPRFPLTFSAFSVGLFANAVLPGRIGELARVAVLTRRFPRRKGLWATLVSTVFAHRLFDVVPVLLLVVYVLVTAKIPPTAITALIAAIAVGVTLFVVAFLAARRHHVSVSIESLGAVRRLVAMARNGLGVMHDPVAAAGAVMFQISGWICQLFAVWTTMRAFDIHAPVAAAGLVLLLMNVVLLFPIIPGNIGIVQQAIAAPLTQYGVAYAHGIAYGFGLQAIEASVGIGVGLVFLGKEGLSFAMLRVMPPATEAEVAEEEAGEGERDAAARERASVPR
jgi:glycosyltransferase 2 family protein